VRSPHWSERRQSSEGGRGTGPGRCGRCRGPPRRPAAAGCVASRRSRGLAGRGRRRRPRGRPAGAAIGPPGGRPGAAAPGCPGPGRCRGAGPGPGRPAPPPPLAARPVCPAPPAAPAASNAAAARAAESNVCSGPWPATYQPHPRTQAPTKNVDNHLGRVVRAPGYRRRMLAAPVAQRVVDPSAKRSTTGGLHPQTRSGLTERAPGRGFLAARPRSGFIYPRPRAR